MEYTTKTTDTTDTTSTEAKTETLTNTPPEKPEEGEETEMGGGPMGGERPEEMALTSTTSENEWLVPMSAAGVVAGSVIVSAIAICIMIWKFGCKCGGCGCKN